ncbi:MAG: FAD-binding oxidoreductase [Candidatus Omnitrophota bacterium]
MMLNNNKPDHSNKPLDKAFIKILRGLFPSERLSADPVDLLTYSYDATKKEYLPQMVVWAENAEEISALLRAACEYQVPVYPRGGGTGLSGGALATHGGVLLSMERMDKILNLDEENRLLTAQPGVPLGVLKAAAQKRGLFYPPDPSSAKTASLGGTLAECAGGLNCVKYGTTKDWIQSIQAVLPTGEIVKAGTKARKNVVGYNLLQLLIGSEGTLAVITEATVRLIPNPSAHSAFAALFDSIDDSSQAVQAILKSGVTPCALEFIDRQCLEAANEYVQDRRIPIAEALLLVETDGFDELLVGQDARALADICRQQGASEIRPAQTEEERQALWDIRRSLSPAMYAKAPFKTNEDVCVPVSAYPLLMQKAYEISERHRVMTLCFGHAGDGNIHVNFMSRLENDPSVIAAVKDLFRAVVDMGGSISGEHGIGIAKAPYISFELGECERKLITDIKRLFDPHNILNPEKIVV